MQTEGFFSVLCFVMLLYQDYIVAPYVAWTDLKEEILLLQLPK